MSASLQNAAFHNLFLAIIKENGYYQKLRHFMKVRGFSFDSMASMLYAGYDRVTDGMSIYYYMDSLEDYLSEFSIRGLNDIDDIVQACYDHDYWKEC